MVTLARMNSIEDAMRCQFEGVFTALASISVLTAVLAVIEGFLWDMKVSGGIISTAQLII